jgi:hypothetical protein
MRSVPNRPVIGLLGLVLVAALLVVHLRHSGKPAPLIAGATLANAGPLIADSNGSVPVLAPIPDVSGPAPIQDLLTGSNAPAEDENVAVTAIESSWAKELRELTELAARDPAAALAQVAGMADKEERNAALKAVCLQLATNNPALAVTAAWNLELGKFSDEPSDKVGLETFASQWAAADVPAALAWASELPADDEGRRDRILKGFVSILSQTLPEDAANLVTEDMNPDEVAQFDAAMMVVGQWAVRDYNAAKAWVDRFPEGPVRDRAREELAKALSQKQ